MHPEEAARKNIDQLLDQAGWKIQDYNELNLGASLGIAVREFPLKTGFADYFLFINRKIIGVIEAKAEGTTLSGVEIQTDKYLDGVPEIFLSNNLPPRFGYESTGVETFFRDMNDPDYRSRRIFAFHTPQTLVELFKDEDTLRLKLRNLPPLMEEGLWAPQIEAIKNLERSHALGKPRALIQMATGSGKTFTSVSFVYRLIKFGNARRVLFLVDRNNLARQAKKEFEQYPTPDDGRKFVELYNIQHLTSNVLDPVSRVCITTIQRLYSMLKNEPECDEELEEKSLYEISPKDEKAKDISYNANIPIETFDFIITDECHRSIYNLWRQVLEYFDAFIIGLTATPSKQTIGFFNQNLVMEYSHERAVADGINVGYDVFRIKTEITEKGSKIEAGLWIDKRDKLTRRVRWEQLDEEFEYEAKQLDRDVVAVDQIRTVIKIFKESLFTKIFPRRKIVPKTIIFAKDDSHADDIVRIAREVFNKGNEFCQKITYKSHGKPEDLISSFRNSFNPRIVVSVDMISTGTNIKPVECLLFMRNIKSRVYFEQMKGRGTRVISSTDLRAVTPDVYKKTHFVIVDAVGVCESDKTESRPLERKPFVPFEKLLDQVAIGARDEDTIITLGNRLARLDRNLDVEDREKIEEITGGTAIKQIINNLFDTVDPDIIVDKAKERFQTGIPTEEQKKEISDELKENACRTFDNADLRNVLIDLKKKNEQILDKISKDSEIFVGWDTQAKEKARTIIDSFKKFIEENRDEIIALQIIFTQPYGKRHLTFEQIMELSESIEKPPHNFTTEILWKAYEQLEKSKVRGAGPKKLLTDIISIIRFTLGEADVLEPYYETINRKFNEWLGIQKSLGKIFTSEQLEWLNMIKDHIVSSLKIELDDFELAPFYEKGGRFKAYQLFEQDLSFILDELNEVLSI
ncbi:MAG: type I restriction-modification enzyme R subunit C-terminal domain-containing protein [Candidatus Hodarchaeota archaeon]